MNKKSVGSKEAAEKLVKNIRGAIDRAPIGLVT